MGALQIMATVRLELKDQSIGVLRTLERAVAFISTYAGPDGKEYKKSNTRFLGADTTPKKKKVLLITSVRFSYRDEVHQHDLYCVDNVWYVNFPEYTRDGHKNYWYTLTVDNDNLLQAIMDGNITFTSLNQTKLEEGFTFGTNNKFSATIIMKGHPKFLLPFPDASSYREYDAGSIDFIRRTREKGDADAWKEYFAHAN